MAECLAVAGLVHAMAARVPSVPKGCALAQQLTWCAACCTLWASRATLERVKRRPVVSAELRLITTQTRGLTSYRGKCNLQLIFLSQM